MTNEDDPELRRNVDELAGLAFTLDATRVIAGAERRRRRRRTVGSAVLAATMTAAVIAAATAVTAVTGPPDTPQQRADGPPIASATQEAPPSPRPYRGTAGPGARTDYVDPLPGVPAGDAALEQISWAEVRRRCTLRGADAEDLRPIHPPVFRAGLVVGYSIDDPKSFPIGDPTGCLVPGDSKPTAAGRAAYRANPIPTDRASQLGNCSVALWHDVRSWRVLSADEAPGIEIRLVLRSPNGQHIALCRLISRYFGPFPEVEMLRDVNIHPPHPPEQPFGSYGFDYTGSCEQLAATRVMPACTGTLVATVGRMRKDATRVVLTSRTGAQHEVKVTDGWYAVAWLDPSPQPGHRVTVYNAAGEVIYRG